MTQPAPELLMVAFGGPTPGCCEQFTPCPGEAYCFVSGIFEHHPAYRKRIAEVVAHYQTLGGYSDFNPHTERQATALAAELTQRGLPLQVRCGYHRWPPYVHEVLAGMTTEGVKEVLVLVMAPHQSSVSWDRYLRLVDEGIEQAGAQAPHVLGVLDPWWREAGFIEAIAARIAAAADAGSVDLNAPETELMLTAHAIPEPVSRTSPYCQQVEDTAALVARQLGLSGYTLAYQSQPRDSAIPWTKPSLEEAIATCAAAGKTAIISTSIGFLCDNVEVLYDLGIEGKRCADRYGLTFIRTESVHSHPAFIRMLADRVETKLAELGGRMSCD